MVALNRLIGGSMEGLNLGKPAQTLRPVHTGTFGEKCRKTRQVNECCNTCYHMGSTSSVHLI